MQKRTILITGGAGFIGSHLVNHMVENYPLYDIHVIDSLTYAGDKKNLKDCIDSVTFHKVSITNKRFIDNLETNIIGTQNLINSSLKHNVNKFLQVSTDEVYGSLDYNDGRTFYEFTPFSPSSPYSASKASADFLVLAACRTYNLPACITHCSNNYGSRQHSEKLIPKVIKCLKENNQIPIYGEGQNIRDWIHVKDHVRALDKVFHSGKNGDRYNVGSNTEFTNLELVKKICMTYDNIKGLVPGTSSRLISFVSDRPGHDLRYSINSDKIYTKLRWKAEVNFNLGMAETVKSYL